MEKHIYDNSSDKGLVSEYMKSSAMCSNILLNERKTNNTI